MDVNYIDRETGQVCTESVLGDKALRFAYETLLGRALWPGLFYGRWASALLGRYYDSRRSRRAIAALAATPGLRAEEAEKPWTEYATFNEFFTRKLKPGTRPAASGEGVLCAPADGRLLVYPDIAPDAAVPVKGVVRSLEHLCGHPLSARRYGVAVVRLAPVDYHRFHYPCDCEQAGEPRRIPGKYHSVNPIAFRRAPDVFTENARAVSELVSPVFGSMIYLEVGAFGVGSIIHTAASGPHRKLDEKGYFKFGGSTVILILEQDKIMFDADLVENSRNALETLIRCGDRIGGRP
ncbi:MAG: archaetidylserine decarboxylase [Lentisphaeria bacterium]|nr:archaetidylserine decarboxylase [Lentisphaeria bacterium]